MTGLLFSPVLRQEKVFAALSGQRVLPSTDNPLLFNFNENVAEMSPKIKKVILAHLSGTFRYPDTPQIEFIADITHYYDASERQISLGNGSSEKI